MPLMKRAEAFRLATLEGYVVIFEADKPTEVPTSIVSQARAIGATLVDPAVSPPLEKQPETQPKVAAVEGDAREEKIKAAFASIAAKNDSADFTPGGKPKLKAVSALTGFETNVQEIATLWDAFSASLKA